MLFTFFFHLQYFNIYNFQLLSLKAELLRKHNEVNKAKSSHQISNFMARRKHTEKPENTKVPNAEKTNANIKSSSAESTEDTALLQKSRKILEAKSKFYDKMCSTGGALNSDENCLVRFNDKKQEATVSRTHSRIGCSSSSDSSSSDNEANDNDNSIDESGDWVEYTDCLGRTRKCLKEDVDFFKKKDLDLADTVAARKEDNFVEPQPPKWIVDTIGDTGVVNECEERSIDDDEMSMISNTSKIEDMRQNWEKQEAENINKDYVHYQNVLFDGKLTHHTVQEECLW